MKRVLIVVGVLFALFVAFQGYSWFGAAPAVVVSKETTFVTEPLTDDGLPDFHLAILQRQKRGSTPTNNGALPFWQAMGPFEMERGAFAEICTEIGLEQVDLSACLTPVHSPSVVDSVAAWIVAQRHEGGADPGADQEPSADAYSDYSQSRQDDLRSLAAEILEWSRENAWTGRDLPPLKAWMEDNQRPINLLAEAAAKPEFYSPSPSLLQPEPEAMVAVLLPDVAAIRSALRALQTRAMYRVGRKDFQGAWSDSRACWQLGEHAGRGWSLIHRLIAIACRGVAMRGTLVILDQPDLPPATAQQILDDLSSMPGRISMAEAMDVGERLAFIESTIRMQSSGEGLEALTGNSGVVNQMNLVRIDVNRILRKGNRWYDRLVEAASVDDRSDRLVKLGAFDAELSAVGQLNPARAVGALLSRSQRSDLIGDVLLSLFLPAVSAACNAEDRDDANMTIARTAAALAVYRLEHGDYPEQIDALIPEILSEEPIDLYSSQPLIYERRGDGYLLYSVFENSQDDGGDDFTGRIVDGEWVAADAVYDVPGGGDLVIRMPMPKRERPQMETRDAD